MNSLAVNKKIYSTHLLRWKSSDRYRLFSELPVGEITSLCNSNMFPKTNAILHSELFSEMLQYPKKLTSDFVSTSNFKLSVPKTASYYISAFQLQLERNQQQSLYFQNSQNLKLASVLINSNIFFWFWRIIGDSFHITNQIFDLFPLITPQDDSYLKYYNHLNDAQEECTVYKQYRGIAIPNVNYNQRMDILLEIDKWILSHFKYGENIDPTTMLWAKSNSFLKLAIPKVNGLPDSLKYISDELRDDLNSEGDGDDGDGEGNS